MYMRVSKNKFVTVTYDLHVGDADDRTLMESATPEQPLKFIYGIGAMLEAFEKNLSGLEPGDRFEFSLTPEQAYGQRIEENVVDLPKSVFMVDGVFDSERVKEGATLPTHERLRAGGEGGCRSDGLQSPVGGRDAALRRTGGRRTRADG